MTRTADAVDAVAEANGNSEAATVDTTIAAPTRRFRRAGEVVRATRRGVGMALLIGGITTEASQGTHTVVCGPPQHRAGPATSLARLLRIAEL